MRRVTETVKFIQGLLIEGERVIITRTGCDIDLEDSDDTVETLMTADELNQWAKDIFKEDKELETY